MGKYYVVKMSNGEKYAIPAKTIASNYAKYYEKEHGEGFKENFDAMMEWFDRKDYKFADWAKNNMDWNDVKDVAILIEDKPKTHDYQNDWMNGKYDYLDGELPSINNTNQCRYNKNGMCTLGGEPDKCMGHEQSSCYERKDV